jgi:hypothetical protein
MQEEDEKLLEAFQLVSKALDSLPTDDARLRVLAAIICLHDSQFALGTIRRFTSATPNMLGAERAAK